MHHHSRPKQIITLFSIQIIMNSTLNTIIYGSESYFPIIYNTATVNTQRGGGHPGNGKETQRNATSRHASRHLRRR